MNDYMPPEWRTDSPPKDGSKFLAYKREPEGINRWSGEPYEAFDVFAVAWWYVRTSSFDVPVGPKEDGIFKKEDREMWKGFIFAYDYPMPQSIEPSHWMPLPAGPIITA